MTTAYPLTWPTTIARSATRGRHTFKASLTQALANVRTSLTLFGKDSGKPIGNLVISSNVTLGVEKPKDAGVAVWFTWDGLQVCIPVDRYESVAANLQAIHHIVEARRTELRHGTLALVRATFTGFLALPPARGTAAVAHWSEVLEVERTAGKAEIERAYRTAAKRAHPDAGGSAEAMAELNSARDTAIREIEARR